MARFKYKIGNVLQERDTVLVNGKQLTLRMQCAWALAEHVMQLRSLALECTNKAKLKPSKWAGSSAAWSFQKETDTKRELPQVRVALESSCALVVKFRMGVSDLEK